LRKRKYGTGTGKEPGVKKFIISSQTLEKKNSGYIVYPDEFNN
jgi:hypothetical protein